MENLYFKGPYLRIIPTFTQGELFYKLADGVEHACTSGSLIDTDYDGYVEFYGDVALGGTSMLNFSHFNSAVYGVVRCGGDLNSCFGGRVVSTREINLQSLFASLPIVSAPRIHLSEIHTQGCYKMFADTYIDKVSIIVDDAIENDGLGEAFADCSFLVAVNLEGLFTVNSLKNAFLNSINLKYLRIKGKGENLRQVNSVNPIINGSFRQNGVFIYYSDVETNDYLVQNPNWKVCYNNDDGVLNYDAALLLSSNSQSNDLFFKLKTNGQTAFGLSLAPQLIGNTACSFSMFVNNVLKIDCRMSANGNGTTGNTANNIFDCILYGTPQEYGDVRVVKEGINGRFGVVVDNYYEDTFEIALINVGGMSLANLKSLLYLWKNNRSFSNLVYSNTTEFFRIEAHYT